MMATTPVARLLWLCALAAAPSVLFAQNEPAPRPATVGPPVQRISTASALSTEQLGSILGVRELPDGRVLLNDGARRRLLLMDTTLRVVDVVLDSLSEIANTYGPRAGTLLPFRGDTTLFLDPASYAMVVLDPAAKIVRVRAAWSTQHTPYFTSTTGSFGRDGVDARGRIVYRVPAQEARPLIAPPSGVPYFPQQPDSAFVVAVDLDTRRLDTLGVVRTPKTEMRARQTAERSFTFEMVINPLPSTDDWAVLPDGTVAFVRGRDYRVEYLNPDRTLTSSAKLPFDWQRLTDEDKERLIDSVKVLQQRSAMNSYIASMIRWVNQYGKDYPAGFTVPEGFVPPPGLARDWILPKGMTLPANYIYACAPGVEPAMPALSSVNVTAAPPARGGGPGAAPSCVPAPITISSGNTPPPPTLRSVNVMAASELPDYRPPIPTGSVRADLEGNLWIRTIPMKPTPGGVVYDIVNRSGELVNRLQLPPGYTLLGFGKGKVVYLSMRDASGVHLARVRLR